MGLRFPSWNVNLRSDLLSRVDMVVANHSELFEDLFVLKIASNPFASWNSLGMVQLPSAIQRFAGLPANTIDQHSSQMTDFQKSRVFWSV